MSVRITRKHRRVIDALARESLAIGPLSAATNISVIHLWPIIDRLEADGWVTTDGAVWSLTDKGREGHQKVKEDLKEAHRQSWPDARPRGPKPPWARKDWRR